jgi:hypothetical protein
MIGGILRPRITVAVRCGRFRDNSLRFGAEAWRYEIGAPLAVLIASRSSGMKAGLCSLCLMLATSSWAATYYVNSSTGNDAAAGTSGAPWKALTTSISKLSSGDTLSCTGSWSITSDYTCSTANITVQGNGTSTLSISSANASGRVRFSGSGVTFRGFTLLATGSYTVEGQAWFGFTGNGTRLYDCEIKDAAGHITYDAVCFMFSANSCVISNLFFHDMNDYDLFRIWGVGNLITSCTYSNCNNPNAANGPHADGIQCWWTGAPIWSNVVERCYYVNCDEALFQLKGTPDNVNCHPGQEGYWTIRNCIFNRCPSWPAISTDNFRFYNNLVYRTGAGTGPTFLLGGSSQGVCLNRGKYYNNVHIACTSLMNGSTLGPNYTEASNAFTSSALSWGGASDFVTTEAACKFVNAAVGDFRLQEGSSLIGKGVNLTTDQSMTSVDAVGNVRPSTGAWDLGPFQYNPGGTRTPSPPTSLRIVSQ